MALCPRSLPAPFLTKTFQLVEDPDSDDVVSWNDTGTAFVVWKTADLARDLLPNYFKHNNFSSFVRQLNTYGFRKTAADKWEFANDNFKRGQEELLSGIRRRKAAKTTVRATDGLATSNSAGDDIRSTSSSYPDSKNQGSVENAADSSTKVAELSLENERLRRENESLNSKVTQVQKQCAELMALLTNYMESGADKVSQLIFGETTGRCSSEGSVGENRKEGLKLFGVVVEKRGRDGNPQEERRCKGIKVCN